MLLAFYDFAEGGGQQQAAPALHKTLRLVAMDAVRTRDLFLRTLLEALSPICLLSEPAYAAFWLPETGDML